MIVMATLKAMEMRNNKGGMAKLANASVIHPRDPGSNLSRDIKYFLILFVSHLNSNLYGVKSQALFANIHVY
jgi:hypothetical protein